MAERRSRQLPPRRSSHRRWTPAEDTELRGLYGTAPVAEVARLLGRRFGTRRSASAVYCRARDLDLRAGAQSWSACGLAHALGVAPLTLDGWIADGLVSAFSGAGVGARQRYRRVLRSEAVRFVGAHWRSLDRAALTDPALRGAYDAASRSTRALSTDQAARRLGVPRRRVQRAVVAGRVPGAWLASGVRGGPHGSCQGWRVPETALPGLGRLLAADEITARSRHVRQVVAARALVGHPSERGSGGRFVAGGGGAAPA
jgi:hypothetical protein